MSEFRPRYGRIDREYGLRLATMPAEEDGPIYMVNLMRYRDVADYGGAGDASEGEALSGREADDRYAPVEILAAIGAEVVFYGDVLTSSTDDGTRWDRVGVVRYPTRRSFVEMQTREDFRDKHRHKQAGMAATIVMGCLRAETVGVFEVEGTIMGDGHGYHRVTFVADARAASVTVAVEGEIAHRVVVSATIDELSR